MKETRLKNFMKRLVARGVPFNPSIMIDFNMALNRMANQSKGNITIGILDGKSIKIEFIEKEARDPG